MSRKLKARKSAGDESESADQSEGIPIIQTNPYLSVIKVCVRSTLSFFDKLHM